VVIGEAVVGTDPLPPSIRAEHLHGERGLMGVTLLM
jgi:hypothetical protein